MARAVVDGINALGNSNLIIATSLSVSFKLVATKGTYNLISAAGIPVELVNKLDEGRPNIVDIITNKDVDFIVNTPVDKKGAEDDSYIRKSAIKNNISYMTTIAAAQAAVDGIKAVRRSGNLGVKSLQEFHSEIKDKD